LRPYIHSITSKVMGGCYSSKIVAISYRTTNTAAGIGKIQIPPRDRRLTVRARRGYSRRVTIRVRKSARRTIKIAAANRLGVFRPLFVHRVDAFQSIVLLLTTSKLHQLWNIGNIGWSSAPQLHAKTPNGTVCVQRMYSIRALGAIRMTDSSEPWETLVKDMGLVSGLRAHS